MQRRTLKLKAKLESSLSHFSFKRLDPGAFKVCFIGSTCTALPMRVGSNVTSTSCSMPSNPAGCPVTLAAHANPSPLLSNSHVYSALQEGH